ncbi:MAG: hypothetical protein L0Y43_05935 [Methylococcaceae bacterium]|nr:hypothetical protein [Methylococcaceae bacterium]
MNRFSFIEGLGFALFASAFGGLLFFALSPWFAVTFLFKSLVSLIACGYVAYLLIRAPRRTGWLTVMTVWASIAMAGWLFIHSVLAFLALHVTMIWLIRSLYFYHSPVAALVDLALCGLGLAAAVGVFRHTGSLALAIWCLFLIQTLVAMIPPDFKRTTRSRTEVLGESDRFERAHRSAESALRKLS